MRDGRERSTGHGERNGARGGVAGVEQERTGDRADDGVHRVPGAVERTSTLSTTNSIANSTSRGDDHPRALQEVGAVDPVEPPTDAEDCGDGVHADPG